MTRQAGIIIAKIIMITIIGVIIAGCTQSSLKPTQNTTITPTLTASKAITVLNVSALTMTEILEATAMPVTCTFTTTKNAIKITGRLFILNGLVNEQIEITGTDGIQQSLKAIIKGNYSFASTPQYIGYGCKYIKTRLEENQRVLNRNELNNTRYKCQLYSFGMEAFNTPQACDLNELSNKMNGK